MLTLGGLDNTDRDPTVVGDDALCVCVQTAEVILEPPIYGSRVWAILLVSTINAKGKP